MGRYYHSSRLSAEVELVQVYHYCPMCCHVVHKEKFTVYVPSYKVTS